MYFQVTKKQTFAVLGEAAGGVLGSSALIKSTRCGHLYQNLAAIMISLRSASTGSLRGSSVGGTDSLQNRCVKAIAKILNQGSQLAGPHIKGGYGPDIGEL